MMVPDQAKKRRMKKAVPPMVAKAGNSLPIRRVSTRMRLLKFRTMAALRISDSLHHPALQFCLAPKNDYKKTKSRVEKMGEEKSETSIDIPNELRTHSQSEPTNTHSNIY